MWLKCLKVYYSRQLKHWGHCFVLIGGTEKAIKQVEPVVHTNKNRQKLERNANSPNREVKNK